MRAYQARVEPDEDGRWNAWIEELPGCSAWGYSQDEALLGLEEAAAAYLEDMVEAGEADASEVELTTKKLNHRSNETLPLGTLQSVLSGTRWTDSDLERLRLI